VSDGIHPTIIDHAFTTATLEGADSAVPPVPETGETGTPDDPQAVRRTMEAAAKSNDERMY
jgi:hypothetical protein